MQVLLMRSYNPGRTTKTTLASLLCFWRCNFVAHLLNRSSEKIPDSIRNLSGPFSSSFSLTADSLYQDYYLQL